MTCSRVSFKFVTMSYKFVSLPNLGIVRPLNNRPSPGTRSRRSSRPRRRHPWREACRSGASREPTSRRWHSPTQKCQFLCCKKECKIINQKTITHMKGWMVSLEAPYFLREDGNGYLHFLHLSIFVPDGILENYFQGRPGLCSNVLSSWIIDYSFLVHL